MDNLYEKTLLYDFYGELLTDHQKEVYSAVMFNDLSLSEASESFGISRQGIHDMIRRCDKTLSDYEGKLHLVRQFGEVRERLRKLEEDLMKGISKETLRKEIRKIRAEI